MKKKKEPVVIYGTAGYVRILGVGNEEVLRKMLLNENEELQNPKEIIENDTRLFLLHDFDNELFYLYAGNA